MQWDEASHTSQSFSGLFDLFPDVLSSKQKLLRNKLLSLSLSAFKWRFLDYSEIVPDSCFLNFLSSFQRIKNALNTAFLTYTACFTKFVLSGVDFLSNLQRSNYSLSALNEIRLKIDAVLWPVGRFFGDCAELLHYFDGSIFPQSPESIQSYNPGAARIRYLKSCILKEIARWQIDLNNGLHRGPRHLALSKNNTICISFGSSSSILEMDLIGKPLRQICPPLIPSSETTGPNGIAFDENNRLWLTYGSLKCIVIWDFTHNFIEIVKGTEEDVNGFTAPFAISKGAPGQMLMTSAADHKIISVSYQGECKFLAGGKGSGPGQFMYPLCLTGISGRESEQLCSFWVVDHWNHRLQKLGPSGNYLSEIGGCGLERSKFSLPLAASSFHDGTLAVSMFHLMHCLMLVSPAGEELGRIPINFLPEGMLAIENLLFVSDYFGNQIRVYERKSL
jgi:hypothetical protein